jgi:hypothetical protein
MKSSEHIERIVGQARLTADHVTDARILRDAGQAFVESAKSRPATWRPGPTLWRTIMENKVTRYSAAAVVTLAAALVLLSPFGTSRNGSIVLADVVEKVSGMGNSVLRGRRTVWENDQEEPSLKATGTAYVSSEHGYMEEQYDADGNLTHRAYFLKEPRRFVLVIPSEKRYLEVPVSEDIFDRLTTVLTPSGMLAHITSSPHAELGRRQSDGLKVEGFETNDHRLFAVPGALQFLLPVNDLTARLWIDVDSSLPVGIEIDFTTNRTVLAGFKKLRAEFRTDEIQWNAELPTGIFDPNIPADYTEIDLESVAQKNAAWLGVGAIPVIGIVAYRRRRRRSRHCGQAQGAN